MTVAPAASTTKTPAASTATGAPDATSQLSSNFSTFLTLLTTQLKNQDPTSPMDSNTFTQQLVMYSQVEQQIDTNANLKTLISQGQTQGSAMASTYLGKKVTLTNGEAPLTGGAAAWNYTLGTASASTALTITDANNRTVYSAVGETGSGAHSFTWDGKDSNGNQEPDGTYTLGVAAVANDGSAVTSAVTSTGTVTGVDMTGSAPQLQIGPLSIGLAQVANVQN